MAVVPSAPIPITGPGVYVIPYPGGGTQPVGAASQWTQIKLENASPFPLTVSIGGTPTYSLPAGVADVFPLTLGPSGPDAPTAGVDVSAMPLSVSAGASQSPNVQTAGYLRPNFGQYGDTFPGTYPLPLPGNLFAPAASASAGQLLAATPLTIPAFGGGGVNSPAVNVSNMVEVLIEWSSTGGTPVQWQVLWSADPAALIPTNNLLFQGTTSNSHQMVLAPQGAYLTVSAQAITAGPAQVATVTVIGFPAPVPRGVIVPPQTLLSVQSISVPASGNTGQLVPTVAYTPGRFKIWGLSTAQPATYRISRINNVGVAETLWQANETAASLDVSDDVILTADDWFATIFNVSTTAGTNVSLTVTGPQN